MKRRDYLKSSGLVGVIGLAGCVSPLSTDQSDIPTVQNAELTLVERDAETIYSDSFPRVVTDEVSEVLVKVRITLNDFTNVYLQQPRAQTTQFETDADVPDAFFYADGWYLIGQNNLEETIENNDGTYTAQIFDLLSGTQYMYRDYEWINGSVNIHGFENDQQLRVISHNPQLENKVDVHETFTIQV